MKSLESLISKKVVVTSICITVGALHFLIGPRYDGPLKPVISGYAIDVLLPFALVLLFGLPNQQFSKYLLLRSAFVFGVLATSEMCQYFGVPIFGTTFDPYDFVAFITGIFLAIAFEVAILRKIDSRITDRTTST